MQRVTSSGETLYTQCHLNGTQVYNSSKVLVYCQACHTHGLNMRHPTRQNRSVWFGRNTDRRFTNTCCCYAPKLFAKSIKESNRAGKCHSQSYLLQGNHCRGDNIHGDKPITHTPVTKCHCCHGFCRDFCYLTSPDSNIYHNLYDSIVCVNSTIHLSGLTKNQGIFRKGLGWKQLEKYPSSTHIDDFENDHTTLDLIEQRSLLAQCCLGVDGCLEKRTINLSSCLQVPSLRHWLNSVLLPLVTLPQFSQGRGDYLQAAAAHPGYKVHREDNINGLVACVIQAMQQDISAPISPNNQQVCERHNFTHDLICNQCSQQCGDILQKLTDCNHCHRSACPHGEPHYQQDTGGQSEFPQNLALTATSTTSAKVDIALSGCHNRLVVTCLGNDRDKTNDTAYPAGQEMCHGNITVDSATQRDSTAVSMEAFQKTDTCCQQVSSETSELVRSPEIQQSLTNSSCCGSQSTENHATRITCPADPSGDTTCSSSHERQSLPDDHSHKTHDSKNHSTNTGQSMEDLFHHICDSSCSQNNTKHSKCLEEMADLPFDWLLLPKHKRSLMGGEGSSLMLDSAYCSLERHITSSEFLGMGHHDSVRSTGDKDNSDTFYGSSSSSSSQDEDSGTEEGHSCHGDGCHGADCHGDGCLGDGCHGEETLPTDRTSYTTEKLRQRSGDMLTVLRDHFVKHIQDVSEQLVQLLQERHELREQVEMRRIAIEQLLRFHSETSDQSSVQMSVVLPDE